MTFALQEDSSKLAHLICFYHTEMLEETKQS
jgi:hypothetical protein